MATFRPETNMGYFDRLTDAMFKTGSDGHTLIYPSGILGKGYVVPNRERAEAVRRYVKRMYMVMFPVMFGSMIVVGYIGSAIIVTAFSIWYNGYAKSALTKGLEVSTEPLTFREALANSARSHDMAKLILLEVVAILFVLLGVFVASHHDLLWLGVAIAVFFSFCAVTFGWMILAKRSSPIRPEPL